MLHAIDILSYYSRSYIILNVSNDVVYVCLVTPQIDQQKTVHLVLQGCDHQ